MLKKAEWRKFKANRSPFYFDDVIDRSILRLPRRYAPSARGIAVPSNYLLTKRLGFSSLTYRPKRWRYPDNGSCEKTAGGVKYLVREFGSLYSIERLRMELYAPPEILTFYFGATPLFTLDKAQAMFLAELNDASVPSSFRWTPTF